MNSRAVVAGIVAQWLKIGTFPDRLVDGVSADRAFVMEAVYGVVRRKRTLEWAITKLANGGRAEKRVVPYLLTGLYQILFMSDVQEYAAVNETVKACAAAMSKRSAGFVNAILRRASREKGELWNEIAGLPLETRESHPAVLVKRWQAQFGADGVARVCEWNNTRPCIVVRLNLSRATVTGFIEQLKKAEIFGVPHPFAPEQCVMLPHGIAVGDVPGYREGLFMVQDPSMLLPVRMLAPRPGESVLDVCAAPGGKTMHMAELMFAGKDGSAGGSLVAMDLREDRLARVRENTARMGFPRVEVVCADAVHLGETLGAKRFDAILIDAPCTNTGVLRRRPDARWRFSSVCLGQQCKIQKAILDGAAGFLKPGGRLVYCTCSLEPEEGRQGVANWLADHKDFSLAEQRVLFPPDTETDGLFAALLRR